MDLTDILFSKPFISSSGGEGGSGSSSSNVETAKIVMTITNGTGTITSGEIPDWLTVENSENIFGKIQSEDKTYGIWGMSNHQGTGVIIACGFGSAANNIAIATDFSAVANPNTGDRYTEGRFQITLLYVIPVEEQH